jgi:hypothetical protein
MVGLAAKRDAVAHLCGVLEMSDRRARSLVATDRKMIRYRSRRPPDTVLRARLHELANRRLYAPLADSSSRTPSCDLCDAIPDRICCDAQRRLPFAGVAAGRNCRGLTAERFPAPIGQPHRGRGCV